MRDRLAFGLADTAGFEAASRVDGMRTVTVAARGGRGPAYGAPAGAGRPSGMLALLVLSLAAHVVFLGLPLVGTRAAERPPAEKSVEVELVSEKPQKAAPSPAKSAPEAKSPEAKSPEAKSSEAKSPEAKSPEAKSLEAKSPEAKSLEAKSLEAKSLEAKSLEAKSPDVKSPEIEPPKIQPPELKAPEAKPPEPVKPEAKQADEPKPTEPKPTEPPAPNEADAAKPAGAPLRQEPPKAASAPQVTEDRAQAQALERELAELDAERQALLAQQQAAVEVRDAPIGSAPGTFKPVAMAATTADGEDGASYEMLVFSQIEKAKGDDRYKGVPGAVNVRFSIDDAGHIDRIAVTTSSGRPELDAKAMAIVRAAAPFPKPPEGAQRTFTSGVMFGDARKLLGLGGR